MKKHIRQLSFGFGLCLLFCSMLVFSFTTKSGLHFIEGKDLKTFEQVRKLPELKGSVVYVDVWGTRCVPCIEEFEFNKALKDTFQHEKVKYLYLAVDYGHPDDEQRWRKMAADHNLDGYHILATKDLYMDVWATIKDSVETMYFIPHYIILDKQGNIAYANAGRPSAQGALYRQLHNVLSRQ